MLGNITQHFLLKEMKDIYQTRDLYEAAFLYGSHGISFAGLQEDGRDCIFTFSPADKAQELANQYYNHTAVQNVKEYTDALKTCKDILFNRLRERRSAF